MVWFNVLRVNVVEPGAINLNAHRSLLMTLVDLIARMHVWLTDIVVIMILP